MRKKLQNKRGFTLVELIVCMVLLAIFTLAAVTLIRPSAQAYRDIQLQTRAQNLADALIETIRGEVLDAIGYWSLECWGGATFDACLRFLNEDPWERLRKLRKGLPNTKLQMLLRGQNLLGYKHYADDVVDFFVKKTVENGCDIIRCFDALNDLRNMETAVKATKKYGGTAEVAMSYTISPVRITS